MIVKTTQVFDIFKKKIVKKGLRFKDDCYLCYTHRVLSSDELIYDSETHYPINKDEDTAIPDSVANSLEFQQLLTLGYLEEVI